ncbi:3-hydroxybutyrate dehydrogenase [Bradyrhizobium sp. GM24.11]
MEPRKDFQMAATETIKAPSAIEASKGTPMLKGKVAIITGSTSGIGLGIARELAKLGADLVLNGFGDAGDIEAIRGKIEREHGVRAVYDGADMSKGEAVRELIAVTIEKFGRLDILVNNAGIQFTAPVEEFPPAKWNAILEINLSAAFHGIAIAVPQMKKQGWGRIVNIASAHGLVASTHKAAYVAAKHGLVGLTKVVGLETAGSGVTCNAVCPGWVRTPLVEKQISDIAAQRHISQKDAAKELLGEKHTVLRVRLPGAAWRHRGLPVFACGRPDHGHHDLGRWRMDRAVACHDRSREICLCLREASSCPNDPWIQRMRQRRSRAWRRGCRRCSALSPEWSTSPASSPWAISSPPM